MTPLQHRRMKRGGRGFTLVEILVVVVILAILAAIVLPQFTSAAEDSRSSALRANIHRIRQQIAIYQSHHNGRFPSTENFAAQLTGRTTADGQASETGPLGPYLRDIPVNPFTGGNDISTEPIDGSAWYYNAVTGDFRANDSAAHHAY